MHQQVLSRDRASHFSLWLHEAPDSLVLQFTKISLEQSSLVQCSSQTEHHLQICSESYNLHEDTEYCQPQYWPLGSTLLSSSYHWAWSHWALLAWDKQSHCCSDLLSSQVRLLGKMVPKARPKVKVMYILCPYLALPASHLTYSLVGEWNPRRPTACSFQGRYKLTYRSPFLPFLEMYTVFFWLPWTSLNYSGFL